MSLAYVKRQAFRLLRVFAGNCEELRIFAGFYAEKHVPAYNFFGKIGNLNSNEKKSLIFDVLTPIGNNLMVTPKEVDFLIDKLSELISKGINNTIHKIKI